MTDSHQSDGNTSKPAYRHVVVRPPMEDIGEWKTIKKQVGMKTIKKKAGVFSKRDIEVPEPIYETSREWVPSGRQSDVQIDLIQFGQMIEQACNNLDEAGYNVISIMPVTRGNYQYKDGGGVLKKGTGSIQSSFGFGYSVTDGMVIVGRLKR